MQLIYLVGFFFITVSSDVVASTQAATEAKPLKTNEETQQVSIDQAYTDDELQEDQMADLDPLEPMNRVFFTFNQFLDGLILKPLAYAYQDLVHQSIKNRVHSFMQNLGTPIVFVNDVLQAEGQQAATSFMRFVVNSTFGLLGLFDVASDMGLDHKSNDFEHTFRRWGIGAGPYIVLPLLGPSSVRNIAGDAAEFYTDPYNWYMRVHHPRRFLGAKGGRPIYARAGVRMLLKRYEYLSVTEQLDATADPYAQYRILYMQHKKIINALEQESAVPEDFIPIEATPSPEGAEETQAKG